MRRSTTLALLALPLFACGGQKPGPAVNIPGAPNAQASAEPGATPPPPGLPPMAKMPPPGVAGSRKAKLKSDATLASCAGAARATKDPAAEVKRAGDVCQAASKMKPAGQLLRGAQADKDAHQEHKLRVEAGKCYRVYFATDEGAKDAVAVARDSAGDRIAESPSVALPEDGAMCFTSADEITLMIGVGSGKGAYAAQVWSD